MSLPTKIKIVEVGPRDGLQNEATVIPTPVKLQLIEMLGEAGLSVIESTAFVSPKWVPQMADQSEIMHGILRRTGVAYPALVPNQQGFEAAMAANCEEIAIFTAASESFCQKNINCSIEESFSRFEPIIEAALERGVKVRGYISCVLGCPYEGEVSPDAVERVAVLMKGIGVDHCGVADTIGVGTPRRVQAAMERALKHFPIEEVSGHFHDTYGQALANIYACLEMGIHTFDASVAGLGGCPYAKGATGNVATEDVVFMLDGLGIQTGIALDALVDAGAFISEVLGRPPVSRAGKALLAKREKVAA